MICPRPKCNMEFPEAELEAHLKRSHRPKVFTQKTERYAPGEVPTIHENLTSQNGYPSCKLHGALLKYKGNVWRCETCGWAVKLPLFIYDKAIYDFEGEFSFDEKRRIINALDKAEDKEVKRLWEEKGHSSLYTEGVAKGFSLARQTLSEGK
jgi:ribosomal protein L37AE/L43A